MHGLLFAVHVCMIEPNTVGAHRCECRAHLSAPPTPAPCSACPPASALTTRQRCPARTPRAALTRCGRPSAAPLACSSLTRAAAHARPPLPPDGPHPQSGTQSPGGGRRGGRGGKRGEEGGRVKGEEGGRGLMGERKTCLLLRVMTHTALPFTRRRCFSEEMGPSFSAGVRVP